MEPADLPGFRRLFEDLIGYGLSRHVPFHDVEDLVGSTIEAALKHFDTAKGTFRALCFTTLSNLIKNYWRDRKPNDPIGDLDIPDLDRPDVLEGEEGRDHMKKMIDRIRKDLTPEEEAFLKALGEAFEELESRAVSEAARVLGMDPQKGWDIFRKIQRKAKALFPLMTEEEITIAKEVALRKPLAHEPENAARAGAPIRSASSTSLISGRIGAPPRYVPTTLANLARVAVREEAFARAVGSMTAHQLGRLQKLLS
jgi:DNA-directed RNA polymerase specialized sigma24 family protein